MTSYREWAISLGTCAPYRNLTEVEVCSSKLDRFYVFLTGWYILGRPLLIIAFSIVFELSGQLDEVIVGDFKVPGDRERFDQLAMDCRISLDMSLVSKQVVIPMGTGRELTKLIM